MYCKQDKTNDHIQSPNKTFIYDIYKYNQRIQLNVNISTVHVLDFYEDSDEWRGYPTRVHVSTNDGLNVDHPLFITAEQQKGVSSWELPLVIRTDPWALIFNNMGRTLCPHDAGPDIKNENRPTIQITTSDPKNTSVDIKLRRVTDFYVELDKEVQVNVTPSTPKYYYFSFNQVPANVTDWHLKGQGMLMFNYTIPKSIILTIDSDDELCATVSIQNNSCPVFDNEQDVLYKGYFLTMTSKGGITLTQSMFPTGFYIVFIVRESDSACSGKSSGLSQPWDTGRLKRFRFRVVATISYKEYVVGALVSLALVALVPMFTLAVLMPCGCKCKEEVVVPDDVDPAPNPSTAPDGPAFSTCNTAIEEQDPGPSMISHLEVNETNNVWWESEDISNNERQPLDTNSPQNLLEASLFGAQALTVATLTRAPADTLARRSSRYFWSTVTVAVVYALPVVQLLITYQEMVFDIGNQDLCYYNFLCAHPLGYLSDFNHVFSNIGYVILGIVFMVQVRVRQLKRRTHPPDLGIPQHYGLLYAMGFALSMEGVLSAFYHLCPNKMNFQFDSSFMYMIAVLVMMKLYHNRHSDIVPSAQSTFMLLAFIMAVGALGIKYPSVWFSAFFTIFHLLVCFIFTMKIYYTGKFTMELSVLKRAWFIIREHRSRAFVPIYTTRAILLAVANIANWAFAITTAYEHNEDFARELLAILMGNAILYTVFYIVMKCVHKERIFAYTWVYLLFAIAAMCTGLAFFQDSKTKWSETPAQSRQHNAPCTSLDFYDTHDIWHAASAAGMYFSFNMLLTVDDALSNTERKLIPPF